MNNIIINLLSPGIRGLINKNESLLKSLIEIRIRINRPIIFVFSYGEMFLNSSGGLTKDRDRAYNISSEDILYTIENVSHCSLYAYEDEIKNGYITIKGGHRVGLAGQVIISEGMVKGLKNISFINIRMANQIKGCSDVVLPYIIKDGALLNTLIISPPGCGKTTLLRDIVRVISDGNKYCQGQNVGVVDERSEIAACYMGVPQNDVGIRTDILDGCPKSSGMMILLRSMNPRIIAVDEIGGREDINAIMYSIHCGCRIIATIHGDSIDDIRQRPIVRDMVFQKVFQRYIVLNNISGYGSVENIFDERGNELLLRSLSVAN